MSWTESHRAAMIGDKKQLANDLRDNKNNINQLDKYLRSPLHLASEYNKPQVIDILLNNGADIESEVPGGLTSLHIATLSDATQAVSKLIDLKAKVNKQDDKGYTALHMASESGNLSIVQLLLDHNADVTILNQDEMTPLCVAIYHKNMEVAALLYDVDDSEVTDQCLDKMPKDDEGIINRIIISLMGDNSTELGQFTLQVF